MACPIFPKETGGTSIPPAGSRSHSLGSWIVLIAVLFGVGILLGFIGAGGGGVLIGLLSGVFGLDIDKAIGTALAAMFVVTIFGAVSHYREGHVVPRVGAIVGVTGIGGAIAGAELGQHVPARALELGAGLTLWVLAVLVWTRTRIVAQTVGHENVREPLAPRSELARGVALGATGGVGAGFFGVGMAPYLQLGLLSGLRLTLVQTIGTTMFTLLFISGSAATVLARHGDVSGRHLLAAVFGLSTGSYLGAKFTSRAPYRVLRATVVVVPIVAGAMVLFL
ncbi:MAG: sulfite exporter TauE/SafE family protein [Thermomicrobiales bacterium]|nr:sulfite exporter TauE/SafE family protein [Thermomicrobiales bacterium]